MIPLSDGVSCLAWGLSIGFVLGVVFVVLCRMGRS